VWSSIWDTNIIELAQQEECRQNNVNQGMAFFNEEAVREAKEKLKREAAEAKRAAEGEDRRIKLKLMEETLATNRELVRRMQQDEFQNYALKVAFLVAVVAAVCLARSECVHPIAAP
jgi:hypothetical protein